MPVAIVDLHTSPSFIPVIHWSTLPAILKHSRLYDMVRKRLLLAAELWAAQGFPHAGMPIDLNRKADFVSDHTSLPPRDQCELIGNSMHWSQIGSWYLYHAWCSDKRRLRASMSLSPSALPPPGAFESEDLDEIEGADEHSTNTCIHLPSLFHDPSPLPFP